MEKSLEEANDSLPVKLHFLEENDFFSFYERHMKKSLEEANDSLPVDAGNALPSYLANPVTKIRLK